MSDRMTVERIQATDAALEAIRNLEAVRGPVMFFQSGGCCDGSLPICLELGELLIGENDVFLGTIGSCPVYIDERQDRAFGRPFLVLDVERGAPEGFSLPAGADAHFVVRSNSAACAVPKRA